VTWTTDTTWDLQHELQAHGAYSAFEPGRLTVIPLAYGVFCAAFDFCMAAYCYARCTEWIAAWKALPRWAGDVALAFSIVESIASDSPDRSFIYD
jgi:hypothetical protein